MKKNINISSLSSTAEGIGEIEGLKVFVEGALPDETVSIEIVEKKKKYSKGRLLSILKKSPTRVEPACPIFGQCGGCQIMHLQYPAQLVLKRQRIMDAMKRIGGLNVEVSPCIPSPTSLGYRNKIQLPIVWSKNCKTIGLFKKHTHEIIPLSSCLIQCPQGEDIFQLIKERLTCSSVQYVLIKNAIFNQEALVIFITDGNQQEELKTLAEDLLKINPVIKGVVENIKKKKDNAILGKEYRTLAGRDFIYETLLDKTFKISAAAFFQVNAEQAEQLYKTAIELAEIKPSDKILDAFCGVGTLSIFSAGSAKSVTGIESVSQAIKDARENAKINHIKNCTFYCEKAEDKLSSIDANIVFLNPPRKGCEASLIHSLLKKKPERIIYISCDPATLARDCSLLSPSYYIDKIQPFDMFPQTMHVETIVRLKLK